MQEILYTLRWPVWISLLILGMLYFVCGLIVDYVFFGAATVLTGFAMMGFSMWWAKYEAEQSALQELADSSDK